MTTPKKSKKSNTTLAFPFQPLIIDSENDSRGKVIVMRLGDHYLKNIPEDAFEPEGDWPYCRDFRENDDLWTSELEQAHPFPSHGQAERFALVAMGLLRA